MSRLRSLLWCTALFSGLCAASQFGNLPLSFEPNQGQTDPRVRYLARSGNMVVFLTGDGYTLSTAGQSVSMQITGAAQTATRLTPEGPVGGVSNYYLSGRAITGIPHFERVRAQGIRPGIDGIFYGRDHQVEYDFLLDPGSDPRSLTLRFTGAGRPKIDPNGDLVLRSGDIEFRHHKPLALQGGKPVECAYAVAPNGDVTFNLGPYDHAQPLTIDPVLSYSTYLGGTSSDSISAIAVDAAGAAYVGGRTTSTDFPVTSGGAFRGGMTDGFITKLNPSGTALVYSTYIGGSATDSVAGVAVDSSGNAYATGVTTSPDFLTGSKGLEDAFVVKLDPAGTLAWGRLIGGSSYDGAVAIAVDKAGAAYVTGYTRSEGLGTRGAVHPNLIAVESGFVTKLTASGAVSYFTYIAANCAAIAVDGSGNAYVTGSVSGWAMPVTQNALQKTFGGSKNAFIAVLNAAATDLKYSSFLGGTGVDEAKAIAVDSSGSVYVAGMSMSKDFPTTAGSYAPAPAYPFLNGFIVKFAQTPAWSVVYSTFLVNANIAGAVNVSGLAVDGSGRAILTGNTNQPQFPTTRDAIQRIKYGGQDDDVFLTQFSANGDSLVYSTFLGGALNDTPYGVAVDPNGAAYVAGVTASSDFPTTPGAYQLVNRNGFVSKIDLSSTASCAAEITPNRVDFFAAQGGTVAFQLSLPAGCPWRATMDPLVTLSGPTVGMGSANPIPLTVKVPPNEGDPRVMYVKIGEAMLVITQQQWSCGEPVITPDSLTFDTTGGTRTIAVSLPSVCWWTPVANSPWLAITAGANGAGSRTITVAAPANSFSPRSTSILIGGRTVPVTQAGGGCSGAATAIPAAFGSAGGAGSVRLNTGANCTWTAVSAAPWIRVTQTSPTEGWGVASFTVAQNFGTVARSGGILVGDQMVTITQQAGPYGSPAGYTASIYAGSTPSARALGDGQAATAAYLNSPRGLALAGSTLYIADTGNARIRAVTADGIINTVAGGGSSNLDGVAPGAAQLITPEGLGVDTMNGYLYFVEGHRIRRVLGPQNVLTTIAGSVNPGFSGDNGPATSAQFGWMQGIVVDSAGTVDVADATNNRVRQITAGIVTTVAGGGLSFLDNVTPTATTLSPCAIAVDGAGILYISDCMHNRIRRVWKGAIDTIAGGGSGTGDGIPAKSASISAGYSLAVDPAGAVYFNDSNGDINVNRLRRIGTDGIISTIQMPPQAAPLGPMVADATGNLFVIGGSYVWKVTPDPTFCSLSVTPPPRQPAAGGTVSIAITAGPGCGWQAALPTTALWVTLAGGQGSGNGSVSVTLAANPDRVARSADIIVAGQTLTIRQAGTSKSVADFNGDGVPDLVWQNEANRQVNVNYYGGSGGASYQGWNLLFPAGGTDWRVAAAADFNGDGVPDLVWQNEATGQASVHYYGGSGGSVDQGWNWLYAGNAAGWNIVAAADFNGDGVPDLVWQNEGTRQVVVHYYGGSGGAVDQGYAWLYPGAAPGWRVVAAADFNNDGVPDLVWQSDTTRQVSVHYYGGSNGAVDGGWRWLNPSGAAGWKVKAAADFNGDGVPDLIWMSDTTRQVTVHYYGGVDGSVYQGWNWMNSTGAPGWTIAP